MEQSAYIVELEKANQELMAQNAQLHISIAELSEANKQLALRLRYSEERIQYLLRQLYGSKSEALTNPDQLQLFEATDEQNDQPQPTAPAPKAESNKKSDLQKKREQKLRRSIASLPTTIEEIIPLEVQNAPQNYRCIGEEQSETLHFTPARYTRHIISRKKYAQIQESSRAPLIAPLPASLLEGSILSPSLAASILTKKYCYHQPLYRQEWQLQNGHQLHITRAHLCHWAQKSIQWLEPLANSLLKQLKASRYLQGDETPVPYLEPGSGKAQNGYLWVIHNPQIGIYYHWSEGRGHQALEEILTEKNKDHPPWQGALQTDAYSAYQTWINKQPQTNEIHRYGCWAHVRRKYYEANKLGCQASAWILRQIQHLYQVESQLREQKASAKLRANARQHQSRPIIQRIHKYLEKLQHKTTILPQSALGKAIAYTNKQKQELIAYCANGEVEIDNNLIENGMRPVKLGVKNWLFIGNKESGKSAAIIFTLIENCRRHKIDPYTYLEWVLTKLPNLTNQDDLSSYLPQAWAKAQKSATSAAS